MIFDVATETQALWLVPFAMLSWVHAHVDQFTADVPATDTVRLELDTQARAPVDLVLSAQGQVQQLPADLVLGVSDGRWCMTGISQRG